MVSDIRKTTEEVISCAAKSIHTLIDRCHSGNRALLPSTGPRSAFMVKSHPSVLCLNRNSPSARLSPGRILVFRTESWQRPSTLRTYDFMMMTLTGYQCGTAHQALPLSLWLIMSPVRRRSTNSAQTNQGGLGPKQPTM